MMIRGAFLAGGAAALLSFNANAEQTASAAVFDLFPSGRIMGSAVQIPNAANTACSNDVLYSEALSIHAFPPTNGSLIEANGAAAGFRHTDEGAEERSAPRYDDLWDRVRAGFALPEGKGHLVAKHMAWYLKHPAHLERTIERGRRYLYFIVGQLESRGMPTEIALLPIVESAYNPHAYSRMRAAGMWQFIPGTGRRYGLEQNVWYDGRRDVLAATKAALDYLQFLHDMFDDWELALAAYNWGEGAVQRAIAYNRVWHRSIAYGNLRMPNETRNYLPRLLAIKNLILKAKSFGLELPPIANRPYFTVVKSPGNIEVLRAAQLANMAVDEFRSLNPGYNRAVMLHGAVHQIVLPVENVDQFRANLASNSDPLVTWQLYRWKRGDNLQGVAARFGISVGRLREVNGFALKRRVSAGSIWLVPSVAKDNPNEPDPSDNTGRRADVSKRVTLEAERG